MEPIYLFTLTGAFAMAAALSARQVSHDVLTLNQQALEIADSDDSGTTTKVAGIYLAAGNLAAMALIASLVYGGQNLGLVDSRELFMVVSFPAVYYILLSASC